MPILTVQVSGAPDTPLAQQIAATLQELTQQYLGKQPQLTAVAVQFVDPAHWFVGGRSLAALTQRSVFVEIRVTDETNTKAEKARYIAAVHAALLNLPGGVHEVSYVQVQDVRAAAWGYGGRTQEARAHRPQTAAVT